MPRWRRAAYAVALGLACATAAQAEPKSEPRRSRTADAIDKVQRVYDAVKTFDATFLQRYQIRAYNRREASRGVVIFAKPGKMSFRYQNGNRVVSDGKTLRVYEAGNRQLYEQPIAKSGYSGTLAFLFGGANLRRSFSLTLRDGAPYGFSHGFVLEGTPKRPTPAYRFIRFYVDAKSYQVRRVLLIDAQGNRNRFDFGSARVNEKVSPAEFRFVVPAGTTRLRP
jgi:outer membrane lipoprotein carrier protein